jgi:hypothetical protein
MAINTTFTSGAVLTAAQMNNLPFGLSQTASSTSTQSVGGGAAQDITGLTASATLVNGRSYMVLVTMCYSQPGAGVANLNQRVAYGAAATDYQSINVSSGNTGPSTFVGAFYFVATASGATTVKVQAYAVSQACSLSTSIGSHRMTIIDLGVA